MQQNLQSNLHAPAYLDAARRVRRRIARARFREGVVRSHLFLALAALVAVFALRRLAEWRSGEIWVALGILAAWIASVGVLALLRLPETAAALRALDRRGGWKDCFSSAWDFLGSGEPTPAQTLHLSRSASQLEAALAAIPAAFPEPSLAKAWIAPALALALALAPWGRIEPDFRDLALTEAMKAAAADQSAELLRDAARLKGFEALSEEEREKLGTLLAEVESAAEALADPDGLTAGGLLELLEARARSAERLANSLDAVSNEWASPEMLAEMARHPDTADLAALVGDKLAAGAAAEAARLGSVLADDGLTDETESRFARSLEGIAGAARPEDRERPVGERFGNASRKLGDAQPKPAAREFEELAKHFRDMASREEARKGLEELAKQLREAGAEVGGSELKRMEEIARASSAGAPTIEGLQRLESGASEGGAATLPGENLPVGGQEAAPSDSRSLAAVPGENAPEGGERTPVPGAAEGEGEEGEGKERGEQAFAAPVPGEAPPEGQSGSSLGRSDKAKDGKGKGGSLSAPVPGMQPGEMAPGTTAGSVADGLAPSGQGGDQAGTGTAELVDAASDPLKAAGDARVDATVGSEGESTTRAVEGAGRAGTAGRSRQEIVGEFLSVEEQALDEQSLPMSRRDQVLRYFSSVREKFESAEAPR